MRFLRALALLAALPACDRVFGLSDTKFIGGDDTDAGAGDDAAGSDDVDAMCTGVSCFTHVAEGQQGATEIVSDPTGHYLAWNTGADTPMGSIVACTAATCVPTPLANNELRPHALLHDGTRVMWASAADIRTVVANVPQPPMIVYSHITTPTTADVTSFLIDEGCWVVLDAKIYAGDYDGINHVCASLAPVMSKVFGTSPYIYNSGGSNGFTGALTLFVDHLGAQSPLAANGYGAYAWSSRTVAAFSVPLATVTGLASTPQLIAGITKGQASVFEAVLSQPMGQPDVVPLLDAAVAIKTSFDGKIYVATLNDQNNMGSIVRIADTTSFRSPETIVDGIPDLRDFTFDSAGNIFVISDSTIIRIPAL